MKTKLLLLVVVTIILTLSGYSDASDADDSVILCGVQYEPFFEKEKNTEKMVDYIKKAKNNGCRMVVFPEISISQYFASRKEHQKQSELIPGGDSVNIFVNAAYQHKIYVSWGMVEKDPNKEDLYISQVLVGPNGYIGKYRKTHLVPHLETAVFKKGQDTPVFDTEIGRIAFAICYDRRFPELSRKYSLMGAEILIIPAATTERKIDEYLLNTRAYENSVWVLFVNQIGYQGGHYLSGGTRLISSDGDTIVNIGHEKEGLLVKTIPRDRIKKDNSLLDQRRKDIY